MCCLKTMVRTGLDYAGNQVSGSFAANFNRYRIGSWCRALTQGKYTFYLFAESFAVLLCRIYIMPHHVTASSADTTQEGAEMAPSIACLIPGISWKQQLAWGLSQNPELKSQSPYMGCNQEIRDMLLFPHVASTNKPHRRRPPDRQDDLYKSNPVKMLLTTTWNTLPTYSYEDFFF